MRVENVSTQLIALCANVYLTRNRSFVIRGIVLTFPSRGTNAGCVSEAFTASSSGVMSVSGTMVSSRGVRGIVIAKAITSATCGVKAQHRIVSVISVNLRVVLCFEKAVYQLMPMGIDFQFLTGDKCEKEKGNLHRRRGRRITSSSVTENGKLSLVMRGAQAMTAAGLMPSEGLMWLKCSHSSEGIERERGRKKDERVEKKNGEDK